MPHRCRRWPTRPGHTSRPDPAPRTAGGAQPEDVGLVGGDREAPSSGRRGRPPLDLTGGDLDDPAAPLADQVVVVAGIAQLVRDLPLAGREGPGVPRLRQRLERSIDRGQAGPSTGSSQPGVQGLRGDGPALAFHGADDGRALPRGSKARIRQHGLATRHAADLLGCCRAALRPATVATAITAAAVTTIVPPGAISPCTRAITRRSEEHTSELQSPYDLVCRLLLEKKNNNIK